ncbi:alcohol dehydrogenase [Desulfosarcina ovata subsp. sediminis]|uniref:Alcohol dehydrogenase n=1 Tax=Desulfosarcina ovata subsp. sediminis TaxID=885957 RepID=A0A5K7ZN64_9BACT|nr:iron-containing alcohol dehydrogenase [Desulfosarcina ovata]BBO81697.1 alcohol dehydrogenase [Desulfosarcina ovata subsp. sediminis]
MSNPFQFTLPTKVIYKPGAIEELGAVLADIHVAKALIVTDPGLTAAGYVEPIEKILDQAQVAYRVFNDVEPNPSVETVEKGVSVYADLDYQVVIALGGGSPMDVAKTVAVRVTNDKAVPDLEGADQFENDPLPVIAIPTTAGTGSEVTPFAVITNREKKYKLTIISPRIIPKIAILDPGLIANLPAPIAASTGLDALTHAVESYTSLYGSAYSDAFAEKAIDLIGKYLRRFVANRQNQEAAGSMLIASLFAGLAFAHSRLGNAHAMAHPLGGFFNVPHGVANAILLPHIMDYNRIAVPERFERIAQLLGEAPVAENAVLAVRRLNQDLGIPASLSDVGVQADAIEAMTADAMKSGNVLANPRQTGTPEIQALFRQAL